MGLRDFYEQHTALLYVLALLVPVVVIGVGTEVAPETFWDRYLWEDIWGPTFVDANGWRGGCWGDDGPYRASPAFGPTECRAGDIRAVSGYTPTSEVTYGVALALILYGVWTFLIGRGRVRTDGWFVLALLPFIILGPTARVLEDARVFMEADGGAAGMFAWMFISPWIYFQIGLYTIASLVLGVALRNVRDRTSPAERYTAVGAIVAMVASVYGIVVNVWPDEFLVTAHAAWAWAGAVAGWLLYVYLDRRGARLPVAVAAAWGLTVLAPTLGLVVRWAREPWSTLRPEFHYDAGGYILLFTIATTLAVFLVGRYFGARWAPLAGLAVGINVAILFGHMIDAWATFITLCSSDGGVCSGATFLGLDLGTYEEKHPLSAKLLEFGNGWGFPVAKLVMVLLVVYLLDREYKEGTEGDKTLIGLIRMAIFILGFAPGVRDLLLVVFSMGTA